MDSERFDRVVQSFGQSRSRRQTLRGLAGVLAVGVFALGEQTADAGKRIGGSPCTRGRQCKTGKCVGTSGAKTCSCSKRYPKCTTPDTTCQDGTCSADSCDADCTGKCGGQSDGCDGTCDAVCVCTPQCTGKACGDDDGCGHSCGAVFAPCDGPENCCSGRCSIADRHCVIV